jgi:hypothetical protein
MNLTAERAEEIIDLLYKILDKIEGQREKETESLSPTAPPIAERKRAPRYPLREDAGTIFRSKAGYNWTCPYCMKPIEEGDMIVAFSPKPGARTTYAHLSCDESEEAYCRELDRD